MSEYKIYSDDIWDYLDDMAYMPSCQDREELLQLGDQKRVQIWDYFFRINPDDVGKPQKKELKEIDAQLSKDIFKYNHEKDERNRQISSLQDEISRKKANSLYIGLGLTTLAFFFFYLLNYFEIPKHYLSLCVLSLILFGFFFFISIKYVGWREKQNIRELQDEGKVSSVQHNELIKKRVDRKSALRNEIKLLKQQIPKPPSDLKVRDWLQEDFLMLWNKSKEVTALSNRLINIESNKVDIDGRHLKFPNPVAVVGPAELQHPDKIPLMFEKNTNLKKHFSARRSFYMSLENKVEVLYGVYYLEHILIADNMLATYGLFFDFITGKFHSEEITEQYYKDVVAISTTHEFREIMLSYGDKQNKYVEDAPTFTLSLASGEHRTVTFVSEKYFMEIKDDINLSKDDVPRIYWILDAQENANMAVGALRARLRLHKEAQDEYKQ